MTIPPVVTVAPPAIGAAYEGGFYYGQITIDGVIYNLVLSPRASGEVPASVYKNDALGFTGNTSLNDGKLIQENMVAAGISNFPAQEAVMAMTIGGFNDWYIPSKLELEIVYRNLKPNATQNVNSSGANAYAVPPTSNYVAGNPSRTTLTNFRSTGTNNMTTDYYYSATQGPSGALWVHSKRFTTGADAQDKAEFDYPVRAIRRVSTIIAT